VNEVSVSALSLSILGNSEAPPEALVLWGLCYKEPFVIPWAFRALFSAKVTFNLSEVSLVYRYQTIQTIWSTVFLAKNQ
jgi:hypothetical protein